MVLNMWERKLVSNLPNEIFYIDSHHTSVVKYEMENELSFDMHIVDSEITFNVNLLDQLNGVTLAICGCHDIIGTQNECRDVDNINRH